MSKTYGFETLSIHAGAGPDPTTGARALPIYQTTAYAFDDADHAAALFNLQTVGFIYSRLTNPTNAALETRLATLEGGRGCTVASSGHAAQVLALFPLMTPGDDIVAASRLYGGSLQQMRNTYPKFGWKAHIVDADTPDNFKRALTEKTKAFFIESLANPGGVISDIEAIARIADDAGVPLVVDNTLATPYLCKPIEYGATLVIHSTTKFLSGTGTSMGGAIVDSGKFDWSKGGRFPSLAGPEPAYHGLNFFETFGDMAYTFHSHAVGLRDLGPSSGADECLAHDARHGDARAAHGAPLRQCAESRPVSREITRRWRGLTTPACRRTSIMRWRRNTCPRAQARSSPSASGVATRSA